MKRIHRILLVAMLAVSPLTINAQSSKTHTVQRGETFALVAKRYGVTEQELKNANPDDDVCYVGLKLKIPAKPVPKVTAPATSTYSTQSTAAVQQPTTSSSAGTNYAPRQKKNTLGVIMGVLGGISAVASNFSGGNSGSGFSSVVNSLTAQNDPRLQVFNYDGTQRKGMTDGNGRTISHEMTVPSINGKTHFTYYTDNYYLTTSIATCMYCHGNLRCPACNGSGHHYYLTDQTCQMCFGSGGCPKCKGAGHSITQKLWTPYEAKAYMDAKRGIESSSGSSSSGGSGSSSTGAVCRICKGTGLCTSCRGSGTGMYTYGGTKSSTCSSCNGTRKCFNCRGSGRQ